MGAVELTCERDGQPTRLTCCQCETAICPRCLVRTPVGLKCPTCGEGREVKATPGRAGADQRRLGWVAPVIVLVVLAAVLGLPRLLSGPEGTGATEGPEREVVLPSAEGPARFAWLGEEARDGDLAFVVKSFDCGAAEVGGNGDGRTAQGRFCFLSLTVRNSGRSPVEFVASEQALLDAQDRRYGVDGRATASHPENAGRDLASVLVNPSNSVDGVLVYDVPPFVEPQTANLHAQPSTRTGAFVRLSPRS